MNKKGALELSITTIVVVVIGVTLLTLGIMFVRNMFSQLNSISEATFGTAETQITAISQSGLSKVTMPQKVTVGQGERKTESIIVGNDGQICSSNKFSVTLSKSTGSTFDETAVGARIISNTEIEIPPGKQAKFVLQVAATKDAPLSTGTLADPAYSAVVKCGNTVYDNNAMVIEVTKGEGLFGF